MEGTSNRLEWFRYNVKLIALVAAEGGRSPEEWVARYAATALATSEPGLRRHALGVLGRLAHRTRRVIDRFRSVRRGRSAGAQPTGRVA